jgi:hypothetical protein
MMKQVTPAIKLTSVRSSDQSQGRFGTEEVNQFMFD